MNLFKKASALVLLGVTGIAAAVALTLPARALAWSPTDLPPGWTVSHITARGATYCAEAYRVFTINHADISPEFCTDSTTFQADFDAWVNARYTPPAPTTAPATSTTASTATTDTTPTATTTPAPATTTDANATTTTPAPPPPPPVTVTVTTTIAATTTSPIEQSLADQIAALTAKIATLNDRVTRLEKAGDAAWLAYEQAVSAGDDPATAADLARGTWLNVVYGLGVFAP